MQLGSGPAAALRHQRDDTTHVHSTDTSSLWLRDLRMVVEGQANALWDFFGSIKMATAATTACVAAAKDTTTKDATPITPI